MIIHATAGHTGNPHTSCHRLIVTAHKGPDEALLAGIYKALLAAYERRAQADHQHAPCPTRPTSPTADQPLGEPD